jgi:tRNA/rRNA methyltransferase
MRPWPTPCLPARFRRGSAISGHRRCRHGQAAAEILAKAGDGEVALLFGNETAGLSNAEVQRCQRTVFIPANPGLQLAEFGFGGATAVLRAAPGGLRQRATGVTKAVPFASPPASHQDIERFYEHLERVMVSSGFLDPQRPRRLLPKLRRLFGRAELERDEINILRGLLDAVEKQLAGGGGRPGPAKQ